MKKRGALIFYIGNGVVKAAVVQHEKVERPHILATERREIPSLNITDRDELEKRIFMELDLLCMDIKRNLLTRPECHGIAITNASVLISTPWYISQTKAIHIKKETSFLVTDEVLQSAILEASAPFLGKGKKEFTIIEQKLLKISLNGYPTADALKKKALTMDISVFLSFAKTASLERITTIIEKHFHLRTIEIHSQSLVAFNVLQSIWSDIPNYIISDITSELTELLVVRQHALAEAASFPQAKQYVIRELTRVLGTTPEVALSLLKLYHDQKLEERLTNKLSSALADIKKTWLKSFTTILTEMLSGTTVSSKFFLFAPQDISWLFADFIKGEEYQQFSFSEGEFEVYDVKVADLAAHCTWHEYAEKDVSLAIGSVYNFHLSH